MSVTKEKAKQINLIKCDFYSVAQCSHGFVSKRQSVEGVTDETFTRVDRN